MRDKRIGDGDKEKCGEKDAQGSQKSAGYAPKNISDEGSSGENWPGGDLPDGNGIDEQVAIEYKTINGFVTVIPMYDTTGNMIGS